MRRRERGSYVEQPITVGTSYLDLKSPYGDGPWTNPYVYVRSSTVGYPLFEEVCVDELHAGPPYRDGGPLDLYKFKTDEHEPKGNVDTCYHMWRYAGKHLPNVLPSSFLDCQSLQEFEESDIGNVENYGPTGWKKFQPLQSGADLGVFLGEIREVPGMFKTSALAFHNMWKAMKSGTTKRSARELANHWLNTQFGWMPFLADFRNFYETSKNLQERLAQLRRDNGKWVRRGGTVVKSESEAVVHENLTSSLWPSVSTYLYNAPYGMRRVTLNNAQRVWFRGAFKYYIPGDPESWDWNARAVGILFGIRPDPSLLWELTPWSWLIDWCSNVGDVISNMSHNVDRLVAKYAYVMGTTLQIATFFGISNYKSGPVACSWTASLERKSRVEASPFGFGLTGADFSSRQWSILSSLGFSRMKY